MTRDEEIADLTTKITLMETARMERLVSGSLTGARDADGRSSTWAPASTVEFAEALELMRRRLATLQGCGVRRPVHVLY
jgi:signal transduction histidine kinase